MQQHELITYDITEPRPRYLGRKGIYPIIEDYDLLFKHLDVQPVLANDIDLETPQGKARFNEVVFSRHSGDVFSNVPSCVCRKTTGGSRVKDICPHCGFAVLPITEQPIEPIVWVRCPDGLPAFMNLTIYRLLRNRFMKPGFSTIDYLIDPKYQPAKSDSKEEVIIRNLVPTRGLTYFHDHFDEIMDKLCATRHFVELAKGVNTKRFLTLHRHLVFCQYLPFPSKIGFILEDVGDKTYVDPKMAPALSALINLANATGAKKISRSNLEVRIARSFLKLCQYYLSVEKTKIFDKKGVGRKLIYGVSPHFSFRTVITSLHKSHDHETLEMPWGAAVMTFKLHICAKLRAMKKFTPNEMLSLIYDNTLRTHSTLERIFDELIAESPDGRGIPCTFTRFPSLKRASTQYFYINHIKRDATQMSTSISVLTLKGPNADFDGDYMSGQLALDNQTARDLARMKPYTGFMDFKGAFRVSDHSAIPAPVLSTINHRLEEGDALSVPMGN